MRVCLSPDCLSYRQGKIRQSGCGDRDINALPLHRRELDKGDHFSDRNVHPGPASVKVAQRLLAENAHRFSEDVTIEAELFCDLEWQPSEADEANEIVAVDAERSGPT